MKYEYHDLTPYWVFFYLNDVKDSKRQKLTPIMKKKNHQLKTAGGFLLAGVLPYRRKLEC